LPIEAASGTFLTAWCRLVARRIRFGKEIGNDVGSGILHSALL